MAELKFSLPEVVGFDWDQGNQEKNRWKHNVSVYECEEVFYHDPVFFHDKKHSNNEERYLAYGVTNHNRLLTIVFTIRNQRIRVISARDQNKKEREVYQQWKN